MANDFQWDEGGRTRSAYASAMPWHDLSQIEIEGVRAYRSGKRQRDCPYQLGTGDQQQWDCGFENAMYYDHGPGDDTYQPPNKQAKESDDRKSPKSSGRWKRGDSRQSRSAKSPDRKATPTQSTPIYNSTRPKMGMAGKLLVFSVLGCATVLSQQIWLSYGDTILAQIQRVPLLGLVEMVPMVGGAVKFFGPWFPDVLGIGIWFMINASQSGKDLIKLLDIRDPWWVAQLAAWAEPHKVAIAYTVEIVLAYNKYPILPGGLNDLLENIKSIDPEMINWLNIPLLLLSVLSFEYLIKFFTVKTVGGKRGSVGAAV